MGRIKTLQIKRATHNILKKHDDKFSDNFEQNKQTLLSMYNIQSKKIRNVIAGYITRIVRKGKNLDL
ncbi:30S ribosomal protein S17e [Candidatus Woesearchaeota archaeon]|nr:30S ribosomal protein S17e [Candidatus Woesearchaeota archaeon]